MSKNLLQLPKILLASKSPRRAFILNASDIEFRQIEPHYDESYHDEMDIREVAVFLAEQKSGLSMGELQAGEVLLTADSVVIHKNSILEKPADRPDAIKMLKLLSGDSHEVITGVCLRNAGKKVLTRGWTKVEFAPLGEKEIQYYVDKYKPFDKAGSYGIQEWIGWCKISALQGSYSNVMGLPMEKVYEELVDF